MKYVSQSNTKHPQTISHDYPIRSWSTTSLRRWPMVARFLVEATSGYWRTNQKLLTADCLALPNYVHNEYDMSSMDQGDGRDAWDLILAGSSLLALFVNEITKGLPGLPCGLSCILVPKFRLSCLQIFTEWKCEPRPTRTGFWFQSPLQSSLPNVRRLFQIKAVRIDRCPSLSCRKANLPTWR